MSYAEPTIGSYDADYGSYAGHGLDPRTDDSEDPFEAYAEELEGAADLLEQAAGYVRRGNAIAADALIAEMLDGFRKTWERKA